jgi:alpha-1,3-glucosyltransferase
MQQQRDLLGCILFAALLNMKHLFAFAGPVYFVYTLRHYCTGRYGVARFLLVGASVASVFAASLGPFFALGQMRQVNLAALDASSTCIRPRRWRS